MLIWESSLWLNAAVAWHSRELHRRPQKALAGAKNHETRFKGERTVLYCSRSGPRSLPKALPTLPSTSLNLQHLVGWGQSPGSGPPWCSQGRPDQSAVESSRCLVNLREPRENLEQWTSQSWQSPWLPSRPPPSHLSPFLLKPVECCLIRINGAWAAPRHS